MKQKNSILFLLIFMLAFGFVALVNAQSTTPPVVNPVVGNSNNPNPIVTPPNPGTVVNPVVKPAVGGNPAMPATVAPGAATPAAAAALNKQEKVKANLTRVFDAFNNRINKLDNSLNRIIAARDSYAQDKGAVLASDKLNIARTKLQEAKTSLVTLQNDLNKLATSKTPKNLLATIKAKSLKVEITKINAAHKAIIDALHEAKQQISGSANSTSTAVVPGAAGIILTGQTTTPGQGNAAR